MGTNTTLAHLEIYPPATQSLCQRLGIARSLTQKDRDAIDDSDFAGPDQSFPIDTQDHLDAAAHLIGHADDPAAVKAKAISIAKRKGFILPQSWQDEDGGRRDAAQSPDITRERDPGLVINPDGSHAKFTGLHIHTHSAFSSQGDDETHEHKHEHKDDADHHHDHTHLDGNWQAKGEETHKADAPEIVRSLPTETTIYAPILRVDRAKREVVIRATAEAFDSYETVIGFDGSKDAFQRWRGNIREMHDPTKAVGRAIKWDPVEDEKAIDVVLRVSRGAEDTWQKVLDGTLAGASIGARNGKWGKRTYNGKEVPFLERYDLVEVSLVDNPSCPGCDVKVVRADGMATDVLDFSEEADAAPQQATPDVTRVGARVGAGTMSSMHKSRDHVLAGLREQLANCPCDECQSALRVLDPDGDGDIDIISSLDTDHDAAGGDGSGTGIMKYVEVQITRHMSPIVTRMNGIAARLATTDTPMPTTITQLSDPELTRRLGAFEQKLAELDEVRSVLTGVKDLVERIAAQPMPGGPLINSAALHNQPSPDPYADPLTMETRMVEQLSRAGILNKNQQIDAVLYLERKRVGQNGGR